MKRVNKKQLTKQIRNAKQVHIGPFVRPVCWSDYDGSYCVCHKCWSCKRKMKYNTRDFANDVAIQATQRTNTWIRSYKCTHCFQFHIGHAKTTRPYY